MTWGLSNKVIYHSTRISTPFFVFGLNTTLKVWTSFVQGGKGKTMTGHCDSPIVSWKLCPKILFFKHYNMKHSMKKVRVFAGHKILHELQLDS